MRRSALALLVVLAAACSGGGDGEDAAPSTTSPATTERTTTTASATTEAPTTTSTTSVPLAAETPEGLAEQLERAETAIRSGDDPSLGHLQQVAYRAASARPEWDEQIRSLLPEALRAPFDANVRAARELRSLVRSPKPTLPAWRIVAPEPADVLRSYYEAAEAEFGVPWEYLAAVHLTETRMGRIRGTSTAGAQGPMQFLPSTWEAYGEGGDINDTGDAIRTAARYLKANGAPERMAEALYRYNPTPKYVNAVTEYAEQMVADPATFEGYWNWEVYYWSTLGDVWLPVGYERSSEEPVTDADVPVARTGP